MVRPTGPTNEHTAQLISVLRKEASLRKVDLWKAVASNLCKSTRSRREVNLSRLNRYTKNNEIVVVPGKVLGSGYLDHPLTVAAFNFSSSARLQIEQAKGKCLTLQELLKQNPEGKNVRIIG